MKTKMKIFFQWLARRSSILFAALLFGGVIVLLWVLVTGVQISDVSTTVIATISIFFAAVSAFASLLQAVVMQQQKNDQERPYVICYFEAANNGAFYFVIENVGNSPACDVKIMFSPSPMDYANRPLNEISLFKKPITFLPARQSLRQIIDASFHFFESNNPAKFSVHMMYRSVQGDLYPDVIDHDLGYLKQLTLPSKLTTDYLKDISEHLKSIARDFDKLQTPVNVQSLTKRKTSAKRKSKQ